MFLFKETDIQGIFFPRLSEEILPTHFSKIREKGCILKIKVCISYRPFILSNPTDVCVKLRQAVSICLESVFDQVSDHSCRPLLFVCENQALNVNFTDLKLFS